MPRKKKTATKKNNPTYYKAKNGRFYKKVVIDGKTRCRFVSNAEALGTIKAPKQKSTKTKKESQSQSGSKSPASPPPPTPKPKRQRKKKTKEMPEIKEEDAPSPEA